ncbi:sensor histidine kinase [Candidatus Galacturonibacter soehngenii]|uniref:HAMP domain-containing protein n=1 Tax=Candidatus Galacturonatibacter soehngenii TaxID=2307010 RepID=A0A7V7UBM8_9FIRM|nr:histidine kinase [Candidatus Galacturonibacter soehngenii]KAB1437925.1 HAMP domain-containing protein [Candidatus Galacturonibacter soehngenii]
MGELWQQIIRRVDDYEIKKKLRILYVYCVLIPLILTDSVILYIVVQTEHKSMQSGMENIASAVHYNLAYDIESAANATKKIYMNKYVNQFMDKEYKSELDYYLSYQTFMKDSLFESSIGITDSMITMYADNATIVNGGEFSRLETVKEQKWYQYLQMANQDMALFIYYDNSKSPAVDAKRKISFIRKLNFYKRDSCEKIVKLDMDYSSMVRSFVKMNYDAPVFVCFDNQIILSNTGHTNVGSDFDTFMLKKKVGFTKSITLYGMDLDIYVLKPKAQIVTQIRSNMPIIFLLILINAILPWIFMMIINRSFTTRLQELSKVFMHMDEEKLAEIKNVRGKDEIGSVMRNYNRMVRTINELIQTVYIDRLREQEMDIERQKAQLLALHSQINPHFLFNALESIRMHSILKQEFETAHMVEQLALMERQNFDWRTDYISVAEEIKFVKAYLELQKYRFGEKLSYELDIEEDCQQFKIPKLTIVTFVENACVHGMESKATPGWIFIRIYKKEGYFYIEVEDTGAGIDTMLLQELKDKMKYANIEQLKNKKGVGMLNACLRLKMATKNKVSFEVESEVGVFTLITIKIPTFCILE